MLRSTATIGAVALLLASPPAYAGLITNGGFETASAGNSLPGFGGTSLVAGSTAIAGWTVFGTNDIAWLPDPNMSDITTPYGTYSLDLTGYADSPPYGGIEQTIATTTGYSYTLSFAIGVDQSNPLLMGPAAVTASAGATSQDFSANPAGTGNIWTTETLTFTATSGSTLIKLQGKTGIDNIGLDNVSVTQNTAAVPEPMSLALFVPGLAGIALIRRQA